MRLVTKFELAAKSTYQLHGLHKEAFIELIKSNARTLQRTNALASLQKLSPLTLSIICLLCCHSWLRRHLGVNHLYRLWSLVPLSLLAYLFPWPSAPQEVNVSSELTQFIINPTQGLQSSFDSEIFAYVALLITAIMVIYWVLSYWQFIISGIILVPPSGLAGVFSFSPRSGTFLRLFCFGAQTSQ